MVASTVVLERTEDLRIWLGGHVLGRVAGSEGPARRERIFEAPGKRWFTEDRPIRRVHADASMFVGGLRALLLQSLHPLAMPGSPSTRTTATTRGDVSSRPATSSL